MIASKISPSKENRQPSIGKESEWKQLEQEARNLYESGDLKGSLMKLLKANEIAPSDKLQRKIDRIQALLPPKEKPAAFTIDNLIMEASNLSIHDDQEDKKTETPSPSVSARIKKINRSLFIGWRQGKRASLRGTNLLRCR